MWMPALALIVLIVPALTPVPASSSELQPLRIEDEQVTELVRDPVTGEARYVAVEDRLFVIDDEGAWLERGTLPEAGVVIQDGVYATVLWAGTEPECYRGTGASVPLAYSIDGGESWSETATEGLAPLASWADTGIVLASGCPGLHISLDNGSTWQTVEGLTLGTQVTSFAVKQAPDAGSGPVVLIGLTGEGGTTGMYRVDLTDPASPVVSEELASWFAISPIAVSDDGAIYVGAPQGMMVSEDAGMTWTVLRDGLESTTLEQDPLEFFPPDLEAGSFGLTALLLHGDQVIVSGVDGLYLLGPDSESWERIAELDTEVTALALQPQLSTLLAQTGGAVMQLPLAAEATPVPQ